MFCDFCEKFKNSKWPPFLVGEKFFENSIRDAQTPHPGKIVFNTMRYRSIEKVHRLGYFQSSVSVQIMFDEKIKSKRKKLHVKNKY